MQQIIRIYSTLAVAIVSSLLTVLLAPATQAFNLGLRDGVDSAKGVDQATTLFGDGGVFTTVTNVLLFVIGAVSVIMIIIGGLRYVISGGDSANVTAAKNTILYAVIGIVVAILAYALVNFVITSFTAGGGTSGTNV